MEKKTVLLIIILLFITIYADNDLSFVHNNSELTSIRKIMTYNDYVITFYNKYKTYKLSIFKVNDDYEFNAVYEDSLNEDLSNLCDELEYRDFTIFDHYMATLSFYYIYIWEEYAHILEIRDLTDPSVRKIVFRNRFDFSLWLDYTKLKYHNNYLYILGKERYTNSVYKYIRVFNLMDMDSVFQGPLWYFEDMAINDFDFAYKFMICGNNNGEINIFKDIQEEKPFEFYSFNMDTTVEQIECFYYTLPKIYIFAYTSKNYLYAIEFDYCKREKIILDSIYMPGNLKDMLYNDNNIFMVIDSTLQLLYFDINNKKLILTGYTDILNAPTSVYNNKEKVFVSDISLGILVFDDAGYSPLLYEKNKNDELSVSLYSDQSPVAKLNRESDKLLFELSNFDNDNYNVRIVNYLGQLLYEKSVDIIDSRFDLNINMSVPKGVYMLIIENDSFYYNYRFIYL